MEIIYSHVKEPLRKGKTPAEVFAEFEKKIRESEETVEQKKASLDNLRHCLRLAWSEVRPIA